MSSIEQKIKALFNLAAENSNATEAEAKTALDLAFKLMAKYNISKENLEKSLLEEIIELNYPLTKQMIFKGCQSIAIIIARYFKVFIFKRGKSLALIGHESKLRNCIATIDYLLSNAKSNLPKGLSYSEKQGYYIGYYYSIKEMVSKAEAPTTEALILLDSALITYENLAGALKPASNRKILCDQNAKNIGLEKGSKANLNKQFGSKALPPCKYAN